MKTTTIALLCWLLALGTFGAPLPGEAAEIGDDLAALAPALQPGTVLILGELHGTVEAPAFVGRAAGLALGKGLSVTIGLEIPRAESPRVEAFLASAGAAEDRDRLLAGPFWQSAYQDGRRSEAMAELLEALRRHREVEHPVHVVCFDLQGVRATDREPAMAEALAAAAIEAPRAVTIALVGNLHARLNRSGGISDPMARRVARQLPETRVLSLALRSSGGTAWTCGTDGCGITQVGGRDLAGSPITLDDQPGRDGYHGGVHLGELHASPPAVATLRPSATPALPFQDPAQGLFDRAPAAVPSGPRPPVPLVGEWPQWMGPRADGATEPGWLPLGVKVSLEIDWRRPIGRAYSSISIVGNRALTLELEGGGVWAVALDVTEGREVWRSAMVDPTRPKDGRVETPNSTPAIGDGRVFAIHPAGLLFAFDATDGTGLWTLDLVREFAASPPSYGMSTSPVLSDGRLFVLAGGGEGHNLIEIDPRSGRVRNALGPAGQGSYSTPVLGAFGAETQLIVPAGDRLYAVRPDGGEVIWSHDGIPFPDRIPLLLPGRRVFMAFQEYASMFEVAPESRTVRELWRSEQMINSYSPAIHHLGAIYGGTGIQIICLNADTGDLFWRQRGGTGTLIRIDDHLAFFDSQNGRLSLVAASPEAFDEAAALPVFSPGQQGATAPSFGAGRIFLRGTREIAAIRLQL